MLVRQRLTLLPTLQCAISNLVRRFGLRGISPLDPERELVLYNSCGVEDPIMAFTSLETLLPIKHYYNIIGALYSLWTVSLHCFLSTARSPTRFIPNSASWLSVRRLTVDEKT